MAVYTVKRNDEINEKVIKRSKRQTNSARIVNMLKFNRYHKKKPSKRLIRLAALKRSEYQEKNRKAMFYA